MSSIQKNQDDVYSRMKNLNSSLSHVLKDLQSFYDHNVMGELEFTLLFCSFHSFPVEWLKQNTNPIILLVYRHIPRCCTDFN